MRHIHGHRVESQRLMKNRVFYTKTPTVPVFVYGRYHGKTFKLYAFYLN